MKNIYWTIYIFLLGLTLHIKTCLAAPQGGGGNPFLGLRTTSDIQKKQRKPRPPLIDKPNLVEEEENKDSKDGTKLNTDHGHNKPISEGGGGIKNVKSRRGCSVMCRMCKEMYNLSENEYEEAKDSQRFCVRLKQIQRCLRRLRKEETPSFMVFMFFTTGVRIQTNKHGCDERNVTADDLQNIFEDVKAKAEKKNDEVSIGRSCRYREKNTTISQLAHCGLFGDPHLKTFFGARQTCVVEGEWVLVDNEYMKVQVTNEIMQNVVEVPRASATKKVTYFLFILILI